MIRIVQANPEAACYWGIGNEYGFVIEHDEDNTTMMLSRQKRLDWNFSQLDNGNFLVWRIE